MYCKRIVLLQLYKEKPKKYIMDDSGNLESKISKEINQQAQASKKRGYYRCIISKGCTAKKQVERCITDASILIITYTSNHYHPGHAHHSSTNQNQELIEPSLPEVTEDIPEIPDQDQEPEIKDQETPLPNDDHLHYSQSPFNSAQEIIMNQEMNPLTENLQNPYDYDSHRVLINEESLIYSHPLNFSASKSEESTSLMSLKNYPSLRL